MLREVGASELGTQTTVTIVDNDTAPIIASITAATAEGSPVVFSFTLNPSAIAVDYTFVLTNGTAGGLGLHHYNVAVTYLRVPLLEP
jgi:hypothetical protein